jgi:putative tricarboxylic transport membrane protein
MPRHSIMEEEGRVDMTDLKKREFILGIVMLLVGVAYLWATTHIPRKQFVDAAFVPYILGVSITLLGIFQLLAAAKMPSGRKKEGGTSIDYATVWKTVGLIVAYAALLNTLGFPLMTAVYLFIQFIVLTPVDRKPNLVTYALISIVSAAAIYLLFRYAFDLMLPVGWLDLD